MHFILFTLAGARIEEKFKVHSLHHRAFHSFGDTNQAQVYNTHSFLLARYMRTPSGEES